MDTESCVFCQIAAGAEPGHVVYEDADSIAFLDIHPLFPGHVLLCPRRHYETLTDLPIELTGPMMATTQLLARAVETALDAEGTFIAINNRVSQTVPHLHIHVVPRRRRDGLKGFFWPRTPYRDAEALATVCSAIRHELAKS